jgi:hypothetical protein
MYRQFDYAQKILLAVEFADSPTRITDMPAIHACFRRLSIPEVVRAFQTAAGPAAQQTTIARFQDVLQRRTGYWEERVPAGKQCFVHYAIGPDDSMKAAFDRCKAAGGFALLGIYHVEPQVSAYPGAFPFDPNSDHWHLGKEFSFTKDSVFWFNFFPAQPYLFEKTFAVWALFQTQQFEGRGENNQLVVADGKDRLVTQGVADFVQVNLNRFTSLPGYFNSAHDAGEHTFSEDPNYLWYGMLLDAVEAP